MGHLPNLNLGHNSDMPTNAVIQGFIAERTVMSWSPATVRLRRWQLRQWQRHMAGRDLGTATRADVVAVLAAKSMRSARAEMTVPPRPWEGTGRKGLEPCV